MDSAFGAIIDEFKASVLQKLNAAAEEQVSVWRSELACRERSLEQRQRALAKLEDNLEEREGALRGFLAGQTPPEAVGPPKAPSTAKAVAVPRSPRTATRTTHMRHSAPGGSRGPRAAPRAETRGGTPLRGAPGQREGHGPRHGVPTTPQRDSLGPDRTSSTPRPADSPEAVKDVGSATKLKDVFEQKAHAAERAQRPSWTGIAAVSPPEKRSLADLLKRDEENRIINA